MKVVKMYQKSIEELFGDDNAEFIFEDLFSLGCNIKYSPEQLWIDLVTSIFPDGNTVTVDLDNEFYLGPITLFKNRKKQMVVIDGNSRLTRGLLLLAICYDKLADSTEERAKKLRADIEKCFYKSADGKELKFAFERNDDYNEERSDFINNIYKLLKGNVSEKVVDISKYLKKDDGKKPKVEELFFESTNFFAMMGDKNLYDLFKKEVENFKNRLPEHFIALVTKLMNKCVFLVIESNCRSYAENFCEMFNWTCIPKEEKFYEPFYECHTRKSRKDALIAKWEEIRKKYAHSKDYAEDPLTKFMFLCTPHEEWDFRKYDDDDDNDDGEE